MDMECAQRTCVDNVCGWLYLPVGTPIPDSIPGDCQTPVCGPGGAIDQVMDPKDPLTDNNECTEDVCLGGMTQHPFASQGTLCGGGGVAMCNDTGECRGCIVASHCPPSSGCLTWACVKDINGMICLPDESMVCGTCQYCLDGDCTNYPKGADPEGECTLACNGEGACSVD